MHEVCFAVLDRARGISRPCSGYVLTVLEICFNRARGMFQFCAPSKPMSRLFNFGRALIRSISYYSVYPICIQPYKDKFFLYCQIIFQTDCYLVISRAFQRFLGLFFYICLLKIELCSRYVSAVLEFFFKRARCMFRLCSKYVSTVLEVYFDPARCMFQRCSRNFPIVLKVCFIVLEVSFDRGWGMF